MNFDSEPLWYTYPATVTALVSPVATDCEPSLQPGHDHTDVMKDLRSVGYTEVQDRIQVRPSPGHSPFNNRTTKGNLVKVVNFFARSRFSCLVLGTT